MQNYTFEDLFIRKEAKNLFIDLYKTFDVKVFKDYFFRDQILRATLSVSNNIAEGVERVSKKEESKFLGYAKGSTGEVRNMLIIANELGFIDNKMFDSHQHALKKISSGLYKMIQLNRKSY